MQILVLNFLVLQIIGSWRPPHWTSPFAIIIYNFYMCVMAVTLYAVTVFQLIAIIMDPGSIADVIANSRVLLTMINSCAKSVNFLQRKQEILNVISIITSPPCHPRNPTEWAIQERHDRRIRSRSLMFVACIQSSVFSVVLKTAMEAAPNRILPFKSWLPYEINSEFVFWFTYIQQTVATYFCAIVSNCYDTIVVGCMMQTCCQLEIFKSRLEGFSEHSLEDEDSSNERNLNEHDDVIRHEKLAAECVEHHLRILEFAETANRLFTGTIFIQYSISLLVICVSIYDLSTVPPFSAPFMEIILYLSTMMLQIYLFCYYGNDVTVKSGELANEIYHVDWVHLEIPIQKSLLIMMTRAIRPLEFTSGHIVVLSLASFTSVIKLSYSIYNFLKQAG